MRTRLLPILLLLSLLIGVPAHGGTVERIEITRLVAAPNKFLGKHVTFHGCLVNTMQHGEFVQSCSDRARGKIIIVSDDTFKTDGPYQALFKLTKRDSALRCVQADFSGVLVTTVLTWPTTRQQTTIKLTSFGKVSACPA